MKPTSKYGVISVAGGSLITQAVALLNWAFDAFAPAQWPAIPEQAAILLASVAIVWPLSLVMPASDRGKPDGQGHE